MRQKRRYEIGRKEDNSRVRTIDTAKNIVFFMIFLNIFHSLNRTRDEYSLKIWHQMKVLNNTLPCV